MSSPAHVDSLSAPADLTPRAMRNLMRIPVRLIEPHPGNVRDQVGDIKDLAQSIREVGLIQPLTVVPQGPRKFRIIAGHRRFAACKLAKIKEIPCVVRPDLVGQSAVATMLVENLHRVDLSPLEEARALQKLHDDHGFTQDEIAAKLGRSNYWVSRRLVLLKLPPEIQGRLIAKQITMSRALQLLDELQGRTPGEVDRGWDQIWFGTEHPLAGQVTTTCDAAGHGLRRRVGNVGCGECWEATIRADEHARAGAA